MSETETKVYDKNWQPNRNQNTPSISDLDALIAKDKEDNDRANEDRSDPVQEPIETSKQTDEVDKSIDDEKPEEKRDDSEDLKAKLARYNHDRRAAERQARAYQEEIARLRGERPPLPENEEQERIINERAQQLAKQVSFNKECEVAVNAGRKQFSDFSQVLENFKEINGISNQMIEAAIESGSPHEIIYHLAKDIDEAERIKNLSPHQMGIAIERVANKIKIDKQNIKQQSKAPPPIKPIVGNNKAELDPEKMSIHEYMKSEDRKDREWRRR